MSKGDELIGVARSKIGQWYYTNDPWERMHPEESGGTDCSGFVRWCYLQFGIDVGTWTGDESQAGVEVARGHYPYEIPWDALQPGDLILMTANYPDNYNFDEYLCHIELYCGGGTMIGHPGGYGPQEKWAQAWMESYGCCTWMVRRVFGGDDVSAQEVWSYIGDDTPFPTGADAWVRLVYIDKYVNEIKADVEQVKRDMSTLSVGGVDYDKLANAVADKLYQRLEG